MYPHERSLVKRLEGKPFALVGVNSDTDRGKLKETLKEENITWRNWWDGGGTNGPIATQWNVHGWPTVYVIDHRGVIRSKEAHGTALDKLLDGLIKEAEGRGGK
jgi:hypothetical protein